MLLPLESYVEYNICFLFCMKFLLHDKQLKLKFLMITFLEGLFCYCGEHLNSFIICLVQVWCFVG